MSGGTGDRRAVQKSPAYRMDSTRVNSNTTQAWILIEAFDDSKRRRGKGSSPVDPGNRRHDLLEQPAAAETFWHVGRARAPPGFTTAKT
jgi:hypothetical protein